VDNFNLVCLFGFAVLKPEKVKNE